MLAGIEAATESLWHAGAVAAAEPQVFAATCEEFVAQMLNLDVLGAIAFDKGCYTGQEVIARAHYRGRVKRRLQRFLTAAPAQLAPGEVRELPDGRSVKVVDAIQREDGRCEFLGVAGFAADEADVAATAAPADARRSPHRGAAAADALRTTALGKPRAAAPPDPSRADFRPCPGSETLRTHVREEDDVADRG